MPLTPCPKCETPIPPGAAACATCGFKRAGFVARARASSPQGRGRAEPPPSSVDDGSSAVTTAVEWILTIVSAPIVLLSAFITWSHNVRSGWIWRWEYDGPREVLWPAIGWVVAFGAIVSKRRTIGAPLLLIFGVPLAAFLLRGYLRARRDGAG